MPHTAKHKFIRVRSASLGESCVILLLWLTFGLWIYNHQENAAAVRRLHDPVSTEAEFLRASCHRNTYRSGPRTFLIATYVYTPMSPGGPKTSYEIEDPIHHRSFEECEAEVGLAGPKSRRLNVWYERSHPWKSSWTLDETSLNPILWFFGVGAVVILWLALAANRSRRDAEVSGEQDG